MNHYDYYMMDFIIPVIQLGSEILQGVQLVNNQVSDKLLASVSKFISVHDGLLDQFKKISFQHEYLNENLIDEDQIDKFIQHKNTILTKENEFLQKKIVGEDVSDKLLEDASKQQIMGSEEQLRLNSVFHFMQDAILDILMSIIDLGLEGDAELA